MDRLPKIIITPADDDDDVIPGPLTNSLDDFSNLFWPYNQTHGIEKEHMEDTEVSITADNSASSTAPYPTPVLTYEGHGGSLVLDQQSTSGMKPADVDEGAKMSLDSISTAEVNLMIGPIRRARKKRYTTVFMGEYHDLAVLTRFSPFLRLLILKRCS